MGWKDILKATEEQRIKDAKNYAEPEDLEEYVKISIEKAKPFTSIEDFMHHASKYNKFFEDKDNMGYKNMWIGITRLSLKGKLKNIDDFVNFIKDSNLASHFKKITRSQARLIRTLLDGTLDKELQERLQ
tara:strand:- start:2890 stop:3279 length:390 start_codon:yes stop_codon:yes gene_type:complete